MPKRASSKVDLEIAERSAEPPLATYRLGVDTVRCVLGCGATTINPTGECDRCVAEHNEVELRRGGWPSWTGEPREGWD